MSVITNTQLLVYITFTLISIPVFILCTVFTVECDQVMSSSEIIENLKNKTDLLAVILFKSQNNQFLWEHGKN